MPHGPGFERTLILRGEPSQDSPSSIAFAIFLIAGSEYRYRDPVVEEGTLCVAISQSGETADTLAALRHAQSLGMTTTLGIINVPTSAMARATKLKFFTRAGVEIDRCASSEVSSVTVETTRDRSGVARRDTVDEGCTLCG